MAVFLLDTTALTHLWHGHPRVSAAYTRHADPNSGDVVRVASVNVEEAVEGRLAFLQQTRTPQDEVRASQLLLDTVLFLAQFPLVAVTNTAVARCLSRSRSAAILNTPLRYDLLPPVA